MRGLLGPLLIAILPVSASAQDTLVVRADTPPVWGANPQLVEELRIGSIDGDPRYVLGLVVGVADAPDGTVWIADRLLGAVRRYSSTGEHLGDVGRRGEGPGEFQMIDAIGLLPGGRVAVSDPLNRRIHLFDLGGRYVAAYRNPVGAFGARTPMVADTAGQLYLFNSVRGDPVDASSLPTGTALPPGESARRFYWFKLSKTGEVVDTIARPPVKSEGDEDPIETWSVVSPLGYVVTGRNDEYAIYRPLRDGRTVRIDRSWQPVPYAEEERKELQALQDEMAGRRPAAKRVSTTKPAWSSISVDADGRFWVRRYVAASKVRETPAQEERRLNPGAEYGMVLPSRPPITWGQPEVFDVIEPSGRYLGTVTVPKSASSERAESRRAQVVLAKGMTIWTLEKGQFDEPYVVRYRIVPSRTPD